MENVDYKTLFIIETAALTHDMGIHTCEEKNIMESVAADAGKRRMYAPLKSLKDLDLKQTFQKSAVSDCTSSYI